MRASLTHKAGNNIQRLRFCHSVDTDAQYIVSHGSFSFFAFTNRCFELFGFSGKVIFNFPDVKSGLIKLDIVYVRDFPVNATSSARDLGTVQKSKIAFSEVEFSRKIVFFIVTLNSPCRTSKTGMDIPACIHSVRIVGMPE